MDDIVGHRNSYDDEEGYYVTSTKCQTNSGSEHRLSKLAQKLSLPLIFIQVKLYSLSLTAQRNTFHTVVCDRCEHTAKGSKIKFKLFMIREQVESVGI